MSTIYALSTPAGRSAIGVLRVSGPEAWQVTAKLTRNRTLKPHTAALCNLWGAQGLLDQALVLPFDSKSYTGEPLVELHCHGSPPVLAAVMHELGAAGCRHAEPGEFTRRAFYNHKLDLTKVEGIRDLLSAETELQRQLAVAGASGSLAGTYEGWRKQLVESAATLTALIDFADDNELDSAPSHLIDIVQAKTAKLLSEVQQHTSKIQRTELISSGIRLVVVGEPNAGKSSLVNRLVDRSACIVSDVAGTTRDVVELNLDIGGFKVVLGDTAGLRNVKGTGDHDELERIGIARAREAVNLADVVLAVHPLDRPLSDETLREIEAARARGAKVIVAGNKSDLASGSGSSDIDVSISSKTGEGFEQLSQLIEQHCRELTDTGAGTDTALVGASRRTRELLVHQVIPGLEAALVQLEQGDAILGSAELQLAIDAIAKITGRAVRVNEVLDIVFGSFCIGK